MSELLNTYLGQYHLREVIRQGGMATVYKAHQASLDRYVAVKVLPTNSDAQFAARFKREARAVAQLQHPNIVPVYDYGEQDGLLYLVVQYIENGTTLGDMLGTPMEPVAALRITERVLSALDYAHQRGIVHRDIKPSNILMPSPTWPLLADFGIAKLMNTTEGQPLTMVGVFIGTPAYVAPEQAFGAPIDSRTDLYSLGVVLYEMMTGRVPFDADTPMTMLGKHAYEPPPPPRTINPDLPLIVEPVLLRALAKDPADRYQSASLMAEALERVAVQIEQGRTWDRQAGLYLAGVQAFEEGRWDLAVERLREVTAIDPEYEDAADLLVAAQQAQLQTKTEARQQLERGQQRRKSLLQSHLAVPPALAAPPLPAPAPSGDAAPETPPLLVPVPAPEGEAAPPPTSAADEAPRPVARKDLLPAAQPNQGDGSATARPVVAPRAAGQRNLIGMAALGLAVLVLGGGLLLGLNRFLAGSGAPPGTAVSATPGGHPMVAADGADSVGLLHFRNAASVLDEATLAAIKMPAPAAGTHYEAWLLGEGGEARTTMGVLKLDATGNGELVYRDKKGHNLLAQYDQMEITVEPDPDPNPTSSHDVVYAGAIPPQALVHIKHLLLAFDTTPGRIGLTVGLVQQATVLNTTAQEMLTAQQAGDLAAMHRAAEGIVNLIAGPTGPQAGDLDGDGKPTNPGDSFGLLPNGNNAGYIEGTLDHAQLSAGQPDATENIKLHAAHVVVAATNLSTWAVELRDRAVRIARTTDVAAASDDAQQVAALADRFLNGKDLNGNEVIDPLPNEAGAKTAYQHAGYLADMDVVAPTPGTPGPAKTVDGDSEYTATPVPPTAPPTPVPPTTAPAFPPNTDTPVPPTPLPPTEPPTAVPTSPPAPPPSATPLPPSTDTPVPPPPPPIPVPPTVAVNRPVVGTVYFREGEQHEVLAGITGTMKLPAPSDGKATIAWLVNSGNGASLNLGRLTPDAQGNANFSFFDPGKANLLKDYDKFVVTSEALDSKPTAPSTEIILSAQEPPQALVYIRQLLVSDPDTPNKTGLAVGMYAQIGVMYHYTELLNKALGAHDLAAMKAEAEQLVNLIEGPGGPNYGDLDKDGNVVPAGDGYGLLQNGAQAGYLGRVSAQAARAAAAPDATDAIKQHADNVVITAKNVQGWVVTLRDKALALTKVANLQAAGKLQTDIIALANSANYGDALESDGQVLPKPGSGGALTCYQEAQLLAAMSVRQ